MKDKKSSGLFSQRLCLTGFPIFLPARGVTRAIPEFRLPEASGGNFLIAIDLYLFIYYTPPPMFFSSVAGAGAGVVFFIETLYP